MQNDIDSLFQVRPAGYDDIKDIMEITKGAFTRYRDITGISRVDALTETYDDIKHDIDTKLVLLAMLDREACGCVRLEINPDNSAYLTRFAVKVTKQNNGIGKSIMNIVDGIALKRGIKRIYLHTDSKMASLIRFYYGRGFYIDSTDKSRGYVRALLVKDY